VRNYISPHVHPQSLDSASTPEAFAAKEVELGTGALVCTDHGSLSAAFKTYDLAKKNNLTPVIGLEAYMRSNDCPILTKLNIQKTGEVPRGMDKAQWAIDNPNGTFYSYSKYFHATLGFRNYEAYKLAVKLLSKADARAEQHGSEKKPLFGWNEIEELAAKNVTMGSGCLIGMVGRHLMAKDVPQETKIAAARAYFERLHYLFKDRFFVEVMPHRCTHNYVKGVFIEVERDGVVETLKFGLTKKLKTDAGIESAEELATNYNRDKYLVLVGLCNYKVWTDYEKPYKILNVVKKDDFYQNECTPWNPDGDLQFATNVFVMGMAKKHKVPVMVSDDSHFSEKKFKVVQDIRLYNQGGSFKFHNSYHRIDSAEAFEHFKKLHNTTEAVFEGWIENSYNWLEGFKDFKFDNTPQLPTKFFPKNTLKYTQELIKKHGRFPKNSPIYVKRLKKELDILHKNGKIDLLSYFMIDEEVCRIYQNQGELTSPGRGSGAGLLLNYLLGITSVDPIKTDLSLERFINAARIESGALPDVDQDLASRDFLVGFDTDVVEFECEDGTKHIVPKNFKLETDIGLLTVQEAIDKNADVVQWWMNENQSNN
jgi:DNA polymerase III alpha subunit